MIHNSNILVVTYKTETTGNVKRNNYMIVVGNVNSLILVHKRPCGQKTRKRKPE